MITDSGMLMGEVLQSSRHPDGSAAGRVTSLLWALHRRKAVLYLPRHIVEEVERDLAHRIEGRDIGDRHQDDQLAFVSGLGDEPPRLVQVAWRGEHVETRRVRKRRP